MPSLTVTTYTTVTSSRRAPTEETPLAKPSALAPTSPERLARNHHAPSTTPTPLAITALYLDYLAL